MTNNNSNLTVEELETEQNSKEIFSKMTYTLDFEKFKQLNQTAALYESLNTLLEPLDSNDSALTHVVALLDHLNSSFFEFIETIEADPIKELT